MARLLVSDKPNNFDILRIAMALLVVWSHSFALYLGTEENEPLSLLTAGTLNSGELAVDVFFMISGFLVLQSWERSTSPWSFVRKRLLRIYPAYMVAICICAFVILPLYAGTTYNASSIAQTIGRNLALEGWFVNPAAFVHNPKPAINGSLWSIPFEFRCYIAVLAMGLLFSRSIRRHVLVLAFFLVVATHLWARSTGRVFGGGTFSTIVGWPNLWLRMAPCFMAGMIVYTYRETLPRSGLLALAGTALLIAGAWMFPLGSALLQPVVIGYCVFYLAFSRQLFQPAKCGDFSYGTYLYAYPIQQLLVALTALTFPEFVLTAMLLALLAGVASWFAVERWFSGSRRNALKSPAPSQPAKQAP